MSPPPRFLLIRRDNIGDLACTTPLFHALRRRFPQARICALVNSYNSAVLAHNPDIDAVYVYTKIKHLAPGQSKLAAYLDRLRLMHQLRRERFDYVILAGPKLQVQALKFARAARPAHIVGFTGEGGAGAHRIDMAMPYHPAQPVHETEDVYRLLTLFGIEGEPPAQRVYPDVSAVKHVRAQLEAQSWRGHAPLIGIHISARKAGNRWPHTRFIELMKQLHRSHHAAFLLLWSPGDTGDARHPGDDDKARAMIAALGDVPVLPYPTKELPQLIAALSVCRQVICGDGGAMHLAAALDKPVLCFFGNSDRTRWYPRGVPHVLIQSPSMNVGDMTVEEAREGFYRLQEMLPETDRLMPAVSTG